MSSTSKIDWTDATLNCIAGCTKVSPGCGDKKKPGRLLDSRLHEEMPG